MLTHSFCFLPNIGKKKEELLWKRGVLSWEQFLQAKTIKGIRKKVECDEIIHSMKKHLLANDSTSLAAHFPQKELWRLYGHFRDDTIFLDIETNGNGKPIVIGMYDTYKTMVLVKGVNIDKQLFEDTMLKKKLIVTFNGKSFDMPRLRNYFQFTPEIPHIDLREICHCIGLSGGLKAIEKKIGIERPPHLYGSPIELWRAFFASGDEEYLNLLIQYNEEDTVNLHPLMEYVYSALVEQWKETYLPK